MSSSFFHIMCVLTAVYCTESCTETCHPLHLTPLIDEGNITAAQELSQVRDPRFIIPKSYAGFITTDRERRNHLFFWFFPSINESKAPLVVWLNGGPGVSSMFGLLYENGPIRIKILDNGSVVYERRPHSWAEPFSMLYIDNPVGVGYSYSETNSFKTTQGEYAEELYVFIEQFYQMFPQYLDRELYIGGQSYAGKYVPAFAHRIHTRILESKSNIPLTGIYLGGPYFDPLVQSSASCEYFYALGAVSHSQLMGCKQTVYQLEEKVRYGDLRDESMITLFRKAFPALLNQDNIATEKYPDYNGTKEIMKSNEIREVIHVCSLNYTSDNGDIYSKFKSDLLVGTKPKMAEIMSKYKVLVYTGDFDGIISSPMVEAALMTTPWSLQEQYNNSSRSMWEQYGRMKGFYTKTGQFCRVSVRGAGHQTPHDQPDNTLEMMTDFVQYGCICQGCTSKVTTQPPKLQQQRNIETHKLAK